MVVKYMIRKRQHKRNLESSSFLVDTLSQNSHTSYSERTAVGEKRMNGDIINNIESKEGLGGDDVHSTEGSDCHEPSVFNGSTIKSEGSWIQRVTTLDIQSKMNSIPVNSEKDTPKIIPGEILVTESKESNPSPKQDRIIRLI